MASRFINGARYAIATAVAAPVAISGVSNANPAVALTSTPPANGSVVILKSGWPDANDSIVRSANQVAATSFEWEGYDTTDTARYPAGEGGGTFEVATSSISNTSTSRTRAVASAACRPSRTRWASTS